MPHVELVHYWPARRPITASRAAIYAALVPAPRSDDERKEAANFVARLAAYEPDAATVGEAGKRIRALHDGRAPKVLDLFAGGGAIPLEAARLGCESHAFDYNPVAHLIELCTLVYPQTFGPDLADDFQRWSEVVLDRQRREIGDLYPAVEIPRTRDVSRQSHLFAGGDPPTARQAEPVAYIWARTVPCRRPGCTAPAPRRKPASTCPGWRTASSNRSGSSGRSMTPKTDIWQKGRNMILTSVCISRTYPIRRRYEQDMASS